MRWIDIVTDLPPLESARDALRRHVLTHSLKTGNFTLKSGRASTWFLDTKQTACRPDGILLVADLALTLIPEDVTAIGGLTMGRIPSPSVSPHSPHSGEDSYVVSVFAKKQRIMASPAVLPVHCSRVTRLPSWRTPSREEPQFLKRLLRYAGSVLNQFSSR